jgi:hypothetical protein
MNTKVSLRKERKPEKERKKRTLNSRWRTPRLIQGAAPDITPFFLAVSTP